MNPATVLQVAVPKVSEVERRLDDYLDCQREAALFAAQAMRAAQHSRDAERAAAAAFCAYRTALIREQRKRDER